MMVTFREGFRRSGPLLTGIGAGLLSEPTFGQGLASGLQLGERMLASEEDRRLRAEQVEAQKAVRDLQARRLEQQIKMAGTITPLQQAQIDLAKARQENLGRPTYTITRTGQIVQTGGEGAGPETARFLPRREGDLNLSAGDQSQLNALVASGVPRNDALGIVSGRLRLSTTETGDRVIVDLATGIGRPVGRAATTVATAPAPTPAPTPAPAPQPRGRRPTLYSQAERVTGVGPAVGEATTGVTEQVESATGIGGATLSPESQRAIADFNLAQNSLIRTLSLNPRFPVSEQERIRGFVRRGAFRSPGQLRNDLISLDAFLRDRRAEENAIARDHTQPATQRAIARRSVAAIDRFLERIGVPKGAGQPPAGGSGVRIIGVRPVQ